MTLALETDFTFDGAFGYSIEQMLRLTAPPEPEGFEAFWRETYRRTVQTPLRLHCEPIEARNPVFRATFLQFDGFERHRLGGWLTTPNEGPIERFVVLGHGYGHPDATTCPCEPRTACLLVSKRGLGASRGRGIPEEPLEHVVHAIERKETYVHRGCTADVWTAASVMLDLFPQAAGRLEYRGASFGGGIGAVALAWDNRFVFGSLNVPSFGNYPLRVTLDSDGSGAATRRRWLDDPAVLDVLAYFDSATHAARLNMPIHVSAAEHDRCVPPPGQFTVYNAISSPKRLYRLKAGHFDWAGRVEDERRAVADRERFRRSMIPVRRDVKPSPLSLK